MDNGGCEQICTDTFLSFNCSCRDGYVLNDDGFTCSGKYSCHSSHVIVNLIATESLSSADIDECSSQDHGCEHTCVNTDGSYVCICTIGYSLNADGRTCDGILNA